MTDEQLELRFGTLTSNVQALTANLQNLTTLVENMVGSFNRELSGLKVEMSEVRSDIADLNKSVKRQEAALRRASGIMVSGTMAMNTMTRWAQRLEDREEVRDLEVRALRNEVLDLRRKLDG